MRRLDRSCLEGVGAGRERMGKESYLGACGQDSTAEVERGDILRNTEAEEHILKLISCGTAASAGNFCQVFTFSIEGTTTWPQHNSSERYEERAD